MEKIEELFVVLEDRPRSAGELFRVLKKKQIAVYAVGLFSDHARLYVSDTGKAAEYLHAHNYELEQREVLMVRLPNRQGALMDLTLKLGNGGININYLYGAMTPKQKRGIVILEVDDPDFALSLFQSHEF